jgi:hypothetical protein
VAPVTAIFHTTAEVNTCQANFSRTRFCCSFTCYHGCATAGELSSGYPQCLYTPTYAYKAHFLTSASCYNCTDSNAGTSSYNAINNSKAGSASSCTLQKGENTPCLYWTDHRLNSCSSGSFDLIRFLRSSFAHWVRYLQQHHWLRIPNFPAQEL